MAGLGLLARIVVVLLLVRLALRFLAGFVRGLREPEAKPAASAVLVRDPVCQTFVAPQAAVRGRFEGREALFCSVACRDQAAAVR